MRHRCTPIFLGRCITQRLQTIQILQTKQNKTPLRYYGRSKPAAIQSMDDGQYNDTVEAVFVFHRHGDRTPGRSLVAEEYANDESGFWKTKIPPSSCFEILCERFPVTRQQTYSNSNNNTNYATGYDSFRESSEGNRSFGFLTWKGLHQMYHKGLSMAQKYAPNSSSQSQSTTSFRDFWDIHAVSTNYLRTAMSCQAFLDGLLTNSDADNSNSNIDTPLDYECPTHYEKIPLEEYRAKHNANTTFFDSVEIMVRDSESETLNAFESSPKLMKKLMEDVFATPEFIADDREAQPLVKELIEYLPGLSKHTAYGEISSPSGGIRINWIHAADHFVCRSSHSVPAKQFCPHLRGEKGCEELRFKANGMATMQHLQQRFYRYYGNPKLLGEMAGPALHDVNLEMKNAISIEGRKSDKKPFRIYSCHDVTILALLYAIQGRGVESSTLLKGPLQWPIYATCFTLELVRLGNNSNIDSDASDKKKSTTFVVRAWVSGTPMKEFSASPEAFESGGRDKNKEPFFSMDLLEFEALVNDLNSAREVPTQ